MQDASTLAQRHDDAERTRPSKAKRKQPSGKKPFAPKREGMKPQRFEPLGGVGKCDALKHEDAQLQLSSARYAKK